MPSIVLVVYYRDISHDPYVYVWLSDSSETYFNHFIYDDSIRTFELRTASKADGTYVGQNIFEIRAKYDCYQESGENILLCNSDCLK